MQAEGLGSKTSKGGFTKDKVREMNPGVRRGHVARQGCALTCIATATVCVNSTDINLVFIMLHLSVRSWFAVGIPLGSLWVFITLSFLCDTLEIPSSWGICSEH